MSKYTMRGSWWLLWLMFLSLVTAGKAAAQEAFQATPVTGDQSGITTLDESPGNPVEAADMVMTLSATPQHVVAGETVTFNLDITGVEASWYDTLEVRVILPAGWIVDETSVAVGCGSSSCYDALSSVSPDGTGTMVAGWATYQVDFAYVPLSLSFTATAPADAEPGQGWDIAGLYYNNPEGDYTSPDAQRSVAVAAREGLIDVTVQTADGSPFPAGTTLCVEQTCQDIPEGTASGSVIQVPGLLPGTHAVSLAASGYAGETANVDVENESTTAVTLTLSALPGRVDIVLITSDGQPVPDSATVCLADRCELAGTLAAAVDSGSTLTFEDVAPGTYGVVVRDAAPYLDANGAVVIVPGGVGTVDLLLVLPDPTATTIASPTVTATPEPSTTMEPSPTQQGDKVISPPQRPTATPTATATSIAMDASPAPPVSRLPSTGVGADSSQSVGYIAVMLALVLILAAAMIGSRRRRSTRQ